jgi:hypothetical protein
MPGEASQPLRLSQVPHSRLLLCRSRSLIDAQRRSTLAARTAGKDKAAWRLLTKQKCQEAPKSSGVRPSGKTRIPALGASALQLLRKTSTRPSPWLRA